MMNLKSLFNTIIKSFDRLVVLCLVLLVAFTKGPAFINSLKNENKQFAFDSQMTNLQGQLVQLQKPMLIVFWATWCKPCEIELNRVQEMINNNSLKNLQVLAVALDDELAVVQEHVMKMKYTFPVVLDSSVQWASRLGVTSTPTVITINKNNEITWMTSGLSPFLEMRLKYYLNSL